MREKRVQVGDAVDAANEEWAAAWPDLDTSPGDVLARALRLGQVVEETLNRRLRRRPGREVSNLGDFDVLRALRRSGPPYALTPGRLRQAMLVSSAGLSGRLKRLEAQGWITRSSSADDRRSIVVRLTPEGVEDLDRDLPEHYAFEAGLLKALAHEQRDELAGLLRELLLDLE